MHCIHGGADLGCCCCHCLLTGLAILQDAGSLDPRLAAAVGGGGEDAALRVGLAAHALHGAAHAVAQAAEQRPNLLLRAAGLRTGDTGRE